MKRVRVRNGGGKLARNTEGWLDREKHRSMARRRNGKVNYRLIRAAYGPEDYVSYFHRVELHRGRRQTVGSVDLPKSRAQRVPLSNTHVWKAQGTTGNVELILCIGRTVMYGMSTSSSRRELN